VTRIEDFAGVDPGENGETASSGLAVLTNSQRDISNCDLETTDEIGSFFDRRALSLALEAC
jgi:hypothetical protein